MHFHVTQVQITNNAHTFKIFSVLLFCDVFSCKLLTQVITQFLLQFGIISICKFFKVYKVLLTYGLVQLFFVFEKFAYHHQIALKIMLLPRQIANITFQLLYMLL